MKNNMKAPKNVIITGSSSGIGLATAKLFAVNGYTVFGLDIESSKEKINNFNYINCDVTNLRLINQIISQIGNKGKNIDILVYNAGVYYSANIENTSNKDFNRVVNTNFVGCFFTLKSVLPYMRKQRQGSVILIGSDQSLIGKRNSAIYGATKGAIAQLTKGAALDYAQYGIRINCVCPGTIDTPMYRNAIKNYSDKTGLDIKQIAAEEATAQPLGRIGEPEEVANLIYFLASDKAQFITGGLYTVDGGYTAQ